MSEDSKDNDKSITKVDKPIVTDSSPFQHYLDSAKFEHLQRVSAMLATSDLVPEGFRGKQANCFIATQMAIRCGIDPFTFLQGCYVVHGKPGVESKIAIAMLRKSGVIVGPPSYEFSGVGENRACTCSVRDAETGDTISHRLDMETARREGWTKKKGSQDSKWNTDPDLMLQYRSAMRLIRTHYPDVLLGMYSREELEDMGTLEPAAPTVVQTEPATRTEQLTADLTSRLPDPASSAKPQRMVGDETPEREPGDETERPEHQQELIEK